MKRLLLACTFLLVAATSALAGPIQLFQAPNNTYANTTNNPCLFFGPGLSGCAQDPANWPAPTGDTGGGTPFNPNPLVKSFTGADLLAFAQDVGSSFFLGLDINDTGSAQTLQTVTVDFFNASNVNIGSYTFGPPVLTVPDISNGLGFADYILAPGCADMGGAQGSGNTATCTTVVPFIAPPHGVRRIDFTFGLTGFNDGPDKLFLIDSGPTPTPFCVDASCDQPSSTPEPATLFLFGTGLIGIAGYARKKISL